MKVFYKPVLITACLLAVTAKAEDTAIPNTWTYVPDTSVRPLARSIGLSDEFPQDFESKVTFRGDVQRYAQLRYGSENSRRVVLVVDLLGKNEFDFYADQNRDRILTTDELIAGLGRNRAFDIDTEIIREDQTEQAARRITVRLSVTGNRLSVATVGSIEGTIPWKSEEKPAQRLVVRRIDGDANGIYTDARDRLQIDLNEDGHWHPISEQFPYLPVLKLPSGRFAVRSDRVGERLSLSKIEGTGNLRVVVDSLPKEARVVAFEAMVYSDDASAYSLKDIGQPLVVPVGRYAMGSFTMTIDTGEEQWWHFVFSRSGRVADGDWRSVTIDSDIALEAVGETRFALGSKLEVHVQPGDVVNVSPTMHTKAGLLINLCARATDG